MKITALRDAAFLMNIRVIRQEVLFYEHCSTERGFFMNITVNRQAVNFYEHYSTVRGGIF
jgi:hypothetical protein